MNTQSKINKIENAINDCETFINNNINMREGFMGDMKELKNKTQIVEAYFKQVKEPRLKEKCREVLSLARSYTC